MALSPPVASAAETCKYSVPRAGHASLAPRLMPALSDGVRLVQTLWPGGWKCGGVAGAVGAALSQRFAGCRALLELGFGAGPRDSSRAVKFNAPRAVPSLRLRDGLRRGGRKRAGACDGVGADSAGVSATWKQPEPICCCLCVGAVWLPFPPELYLPSRDLFFPLLFFQVWICFPSFKVKIR